MYCLFNGLFLIFAMLLDNLAGTTFKFTVGYHSQGLPYGWFYMLYAMSAMVPGICVSVRRLHDVGKSGWFMFIALIPIVGAIWLLVLNFTDSDQGENAYGVNPKEVASVEEA